MNELLMRALINALPFLTLSEEEHTDEASWGSGSRPAADDEARRHAGKPTDDRRHEDDPDERRMARAEDPPDLDLVGVVDDERDDDDERGDEQRRPAVEADLVGTVAQPLATRRRRSRNRLIGSGHLWRGVHAPSGIRDLVARTHIRIIPLRAG